MMEKKLTFFIFMQWQEAKAREWNGEGDFNFGWHDGLFFGFIPCFTPNLGILKMTRN